MQRKYLLQPTMPKATSYPLLCQNKNPQHLPGTQIHTTQDTHYKNQRLNQVFTLQNQRLNILIYHQHLSLANTWNNAWPHIQNTIEDKLRSEARNKYMTLDRKLERVTQTQSITPKEPATFYPGVVNNTNIPLTRSETTLWQKGLE